jgi:hypothetical protein
VQAAEATEMLNRGVRLETVSRLLGHAATTITEQAYAQLTDHRIRAEVEEALHTEAAAAVVSNPSPVTLTIASHPPSNSKLTLAKGSRTTVHPTDKARRITLTH